HLVKRPISAHQLHLEIKPTEQAHLILGWPGIPRGSQLRPVLSVLTTILGGNMSSRLFSEVREKRGLTDYLRADADYFHETVFVAAAAGVDPKRLEDAVEVIQQEVHDFASTKSVTDAELQRAKEYSRGTLTLSFEDSKSVAQFFGLRQLLLEKTETLE